MHRAAERRKEAERQYNRLHLEDLFPIFTPDPDCMAWAPNLLQSQDLRGWVLGSVHAGSSCPGSVAMDDNHYVGALEKYYGKSWQQRC